MPGIHQAIIPHRQTIKIQKAKITEAQEVTDTLITAISVILPFLFLLFRFEHRITILETKIELICKKLDLLLNSDDQ